MLRRCTNISHSARQMKTRRCGQQTSGRWQRPLLCYLLLACCCSLGGAFSVHVTSKARSHLQEFVKQVPVARDALAEMSDAQRLAWSQDLGITVNQTMHLLQQATVPLVVDVKLVGFAGDGAGGIHVNEQDLLVYLKALHNQLSTVSLHPAPQRLAVKPDFEFRVRPVFHELALKVSSVINNAHAVSSSWSSYPLRMVPAADVDALVAEEHKHGDGSYAVYLLNPNLASNQPYAYSYDPEHKHCPGPLWVGKERYAWFDIGANLTFYGPGPGGKGHVFDHSVPALAHYKTAAVSRAILPDLAALVWSACQHLMWPPLHHGELTFKPNVAVHLIYMHQSLLAPPSHVPPAELQRELAAGVAGLQNVVVQEHWISFSTCDHCVTAYASALRARTGRSTDKHGLHMSVTQYLDVGELERWMGEWRESLLSEAGINYEAHDPVLVLPVFIFDLPTKEPILLDGWRQAAALDSGDVVAVRTAAAPLPTFFGCYERQVEVAPADIRRAVLGAVLQAGWGVSDTALYWSQATGRSWNFLWSIGSTPFGELSGSTSLTFAQKDAMVRNAALAALNSTVNYTLALMEGYNKLSEGAGDSLHVKSFLPPDQVMPYHQRITLLLFKLHEACVAMSRLNFALALGYAESSTYDSYALRKVTKTVKSTMQMTLTCAAAPSAVFWWAVPVVSALLAGVLFTWRIARGSGSDEVPPPAMRASAASMGGAPAYSAGGAAYSAGGAYSSGGAYGAAPGYTSRPLSRGNSLYKG